MGTRGTVAHLQARHHVHWRPQPRQAQASLEHLGIADREVVAQRLAGLRVAQADGPVDCHAVACAQARADADVNVEIGPLDAQDGAVGRLGRRGETGETSAAAAELWIAAVDPAGVEVHAAGGPTQPRRLSLTPRVGDDDRSGRTTLRLRGDRENFAGLGPDDQLNRLDVTLSYAVNQGALDLVRVG